MATDRTVSPLRQRMIEDIAARQLGRHSQRSHIHSCQRFAAFLKRSPDTATPDDVRRFQLHLIESGLSICNRNRIMTGVRFLLRVTLRRHDLAAEVYHLKEPQKLPLIMSPDETKRLLAMARNIKVWVVLSLGYGYGYGLRAGEVVRLQVKHIDSAQGIIRVEQAKGRKDRNVMLSPEVLALLRQWWTARTTRYDAGVAPEERWLFPGRKPGRPMTTRQPNFFLPVRVLSRLFRRLFVEMLVAAHAADQLKFHGDHAALADRAAFAAFLAPLRKADWVVYAKKPFAGPQAVLAYLSRYTHRVAISNRRLVSVDERCVTFKWKDYRIEGAGRYKAMTLPTGEFIRRFLIHVLPKGLHRIRHYGLFANGNRAANIARARELLAMPLPVKEPDESKPVEPGELRVHPRPCPCCGGRMIVIEVFARGCQPSYRPMPERPLIRTDTS